MIFFISNSNYNSVETSTNPRLHLLNEALDQLGSSQNPNLKNVDIINKNKTNINTYIANFPTLFLNN